MNLSDIKKSLRLPLLLHLLGWCSSVYSNAGGDIDVIISRRRRVL